VAAVSIRGSRQTVRGDRFRGESTDIFARPGGCFVRGESLKSRFGLVERQLVNKRLWIGFVAVVRMLSAKGELPEGIDAATPELWAG